MEEKTVETKKHKYVKRQTKKTITIFKAMSYF